MRKSLAVTLFVFLVAIPHTASSAPVSGIAPSFGQGCALPRIPGLVREVFGPYASSLHTSAVIPGSPSSGKWKVFHQGIVTCRFMRTSDMTSPQISVALHSYESDDDASVAFTQMMPFFKQFRHAGSIQLAEGAGKVVAYHGDVTAEVRWMANNFQDDPTIAPSRLEQIAIALVCPGAATAC